MMQPGLERTRLYAFTLLIGALVLLGLSTAGLEGQFLTMNETRRSPQIEKGAAVDRFGALFATEPFVRLLRSESRRDVFATTHFNKPPAPPVDPPKPVTRTVALTYLGLLRGSDGAASAFVRVDQNVLKLVAGSKVVHDWLVASADASTLVLTNATQTNQLAFRQSLQLTVPLP